ncbi:MAG: hypothetical protein ACI4UT_01975 [Candidatus Enteromonas sp.]
MTPIDIVILVLAILLALALTLYLALESRRGPCSACRHHGGKRLYKAFRKAHPTNRKGKRGKD